MKFKLQNREGINLHAGEMDGTNEAPEIIIRDNKAFKLVVPTDDEGASVYRTATALFLP